jgi:hypothetical protein
MLHLVFMSLIIEILDLLNLDFPLRYQNIALFDHFLALLEYFLYFSEIVLLDLFKYDDQPSSDLFQSLQLVHI